MGSNGTKAREVQLSVRLSPSPAIHGRPLWYVNQLNKVTAAGRLFRPFYAGRDGVAFPQVLAIVIPFMVGMLIISDASAYFQADADLDWTDVVASALTTVAFTVFYFRLERS